MWYDDFTESSFKVRRVRDIQRSTQISISVVLLPNLNFATLAERRESYNLSLKIKFQFPINTDGLSH